MLDSQKFTKFFEQARKRYSAWQRVWRPVRSRRTERSRYDGSRGLFRHLQPFVLRRGSHIRFLSRMDNCAHLAIIAGQTISIQSNRP